MMSKANLHHGPWQVAFFMVWLDGPISMVPFLDDLIYKALGPLTMCKPNVDQEEWSYQKLNVVIFFKIICQKGQFWKKKSSLTFFLFSLVSIFSSSKNILSKIIIRSFISRGPLPFSFFQARLFCLSHSQTRWTMLADNVGIKICLLETSNSMVNSIILSLV